MTSQPTTADHRPVTVIGLGLMGRALAGAFLRAGHPITVWNRTPAKAEPLVAQGATRAASLDEAVTASPLVVVCLTDYDTVRTLLDPLAEALAGRLLVNLTSGTSRQAREAASWAQRRGHGYLDGAIMAAPPAIGTDQASILYSGARPDFDEHETTLRALGTATTYLGADHGLSSLYDVALLGVMWNTLNGFLQGAALVGTAGVSATDFVPFARDLLGTVSGWLPDEARQVDARDYPATDATLDTHLAALAHLVDECEALGLNAELPQLMKSFADRAVAGGRGGESYSALIDLFGEPARR